VELSTGGSDVTLDCLLSGAGGTTGNVVFKDIQVSAIQAGALNFPWALQAPDKLRGRPITQDRGCNGPAPAAVAKLPAALGVNLRMAASTDAHQIGGVASGAAFLDRPAVVDVLLAH